MTKSFSFDIDGSVYSFSSREVEDLMNDVEIVLLRFFVDHLVGRKSSKHTVVSARRHSLSNSNSQKAYRF